MYKISSIKKLNYKIITYKYNSVIDVFLNRIKKSYTQARIFANVAINKNFT